MRFIALSICAAVLAVGARAEEPVRPNILWLSAEDIGPDLGCYGAADAITPALDRLASEGVRYTNVFTVAPVCAPNRSCIITGVYPTTLGTMHMRSSGEGQRESEKPALPPEVRCFPQYLREAGYYCTNNAKEDYNFAPAPRETWDESSAKAHWRNRPDPARPFFAVFNFMGTHESQVRNDGHGYERSTRELTAEQRRDPAAIHLPPHHPDTPAVRRQWANYHELISALDYWVADHLRALEEAGLAENTVVVFWSDHGAGLPRHKRWLYDSGTHVPLIVRAPKKWQGCLGLQAGTARDRLVSSIDFAPTTLRMAGLPVPAFMQGRSFLDDIAPRQYVFGVRDRMDERIDTIRSVREARYLYIRNFQPWQPYSQFNDYCERGDVQKVLRRLASAGGLPAGCGWFALPRKPPEELYDCVADPYQLQNLAADPAMEAVRARLESALREQLGATRDLGLIPEPELVRLEKEFGTRYAIFAGMHNRDPNYWARLESAALAASDANRRQTETLIPARSSPHAAIRYWATRGLAEIGAAQDAARIQLLEAREDTSPEVRIVAAQALLAAGIEPEAQLALLTESLQSAAMWVRLYAAEALDAAGEAARPAVPALQRALEERENKYVVRVANHALNELLGTAGIVP